MTKGTLTLNRKILLRYFTYISRKDKEKLVYAKNTDNPWNLHKLDLIILRKRFQNIKP